MRHSADGLGSARARTALLGNRPDERCLAHLRTALDPELRGLATQLGDGHRPGTASRALGGSALAGGGLRPLASEGAARLAREVGDRPLLAGSALGLLDVLARGCALFLARHDRGLPASK